MAPRRRNGAKRAAAAALVASSVVVAALLLAAAPRGAAASGRALLQAPPAFPPALPGGGPVGTAAGFGSLLKGLPLQQMAGGAGKAFTSWRQGAARLQAQRRDGIDGEVIGGPEGAAAAAAGATGAAGAALPPGAPGAGARLINSSVEVVPDAKRLFFYNSTGLVAGPALPAAPKDGKFSLLPAGCSLEADAGSGVARCSSLRLEANAGTNALEAGKTDGLVSTDGLNATAAARSTVLTDFARLTLRYKELSLDDGVAGVPVPFDFRVAISGGEGADLGGLAALNGSAAASLAPRVWGMWTNGEPSIPLRSGIFTFVSTNETLAFELRGSRYEVQMLGLPVAGKRVKASDDRFFVQTPRDALLGAVALRRQMGPEWAKGMRVQSVFVPRSSPVKILMLPALVRLVEPSAAMFVAVKAAEAKAVVDAAAAAAKGAEDARLAALREVEAYRAALLAAAAGNATAIEALDKEQGPKQMPLPWRDDEAEGFDAEAPGTEAGGPRAARAKEEQKRDRKQERKAQAAEEAKSTPGPNDMFDQASAAVDLLAQGVPAAEAERRAAEAQAAAIAKGAAEEAAGEAAAAAADGAKGEEVYESDDDGASA